MHDIDSLKLTILAALAIGAGFIVLFTFIFDNGRGIHFPQKQESQNVKIDFLMMPKAVEVGAPVDFVVRITGTISSSCVVPPQASIEDLSNNETVWESGTIAVLCPIDPNPPLRQVNIDWYAGRYYVEDGIYQNYSSPMMVAEKVGYYELTVHYAGVNASKTFDIVEHRQQLAEGLPRYILSEGNRTFEIPYSLSGEQSRIKSIKPDLEHFNLSITIAGIDVNSTMTLVLPIDLLKEMETKSGYHYCVGNEFVIFVGNELVNVVQKDTIVVEILTFPAKTGTEIVYIAGMDLLYEPPRCD